ncbi:MAG: ROK family protein, partial [Acidimicrobiales bacterium]
MAPLCLAVDIGGTKMAAALVDADGSLEHDAHVPTPQGDAQEVFAALAGLIGDVSANTSGRPLSVCGVGCGGPMEPGGETVSPLNIPGWRGFPLRDRLAELTGLPTVVDNDA